MLLRLFIGFGLLAAGTISFADGLPFNQDKTHLIGRVEILKLTATQQVEISRTRVLTLTKSQRAELQKIAKACPSALQVLTNRYDDCSCGMSSIAVWFRPGEVEIPVVHLPKKPMTKEEMADWGIDVPAPPEILIDERLQIWIKGKRTSEHGLLTTLLRWKTMPAEVHPRNESGDLFIYIDTPPLMVGLPESRLRELASRLRFFASKQNIDLFISGFRTEGQ